MKTNKTQNQGSASTTDLKVIGAGLGRTGTLSLKMALEKLLKAPCYHMANVLGNPEHMTIWTDAFNGNQPDWKDFFTGYAATVDWPGAAFWANILATFPDALVLLSTRDPEVWWESANETIFQAMNRPDSPPEWKPMIESMFASHGLTIPITKDQAIAAFNVHNQTVIDSVAKNRLLIWQASEGWGPLCEALECEVPDEPFPRVNKREEWKSKK